MLKVLRLMAVTIRNPCDERSLGVSYPTYLGVVRGVVRISPLRDVIVLAVRNSRTSWRGQTRPTGIMHRPKEPVRDKRTGKILFPSAKSAYAACGVLFEGDELMDLYGLMEWKRDLKDGVTPRDCRLCFRA